MTVFSSVVLNHHRIRSWTRGAYRTVHDEPIVSWSVALSWTRRLAFSNDEWDAGTIFGVDFSHEAVILANN